MDIIAFENSRGGVGFTSTSLFQQHHNQLPKVGDLMHVGGFKIKWKVIYIGNFMMPDFAFGRYFYAGSIRSID